MQLSLPSASPVRNAAVKFEGSSIPMCSLESSSCYCLHVMCDAIGLPFCPINASGQLYITVCGLVLVKEYLCLCDQVCMFIYCKQLSSQ